MSGTEESAHGGAPEEEAGERNEWLELFFDLVVVAAVAVLSEGLREEPTPWGLGLFVLLYGGIWLGWVTVVLYANVARQQTRTRTVMLAMGLVAVMAATAPSHFAERANAFAIAFLLLRVVTSRASFGTGRLLVSWPLLQLGGATLPWVIAMWVDAPGKYALWGLGLVLDLAGVLFSRGTVSERDLAQANKRLADLATAGHRTPARMEVVDVETGHLSERLGLFVIIVLGEAVSALVLTAASHQWTNAFVGIAIAGFVLLIGLWWLTFSYGFVGAPHSQLAQLPPRFGLPMHLLTTLGIVALAAGIGELAAEPGRPLHGVLRWVMCSGLALHYVVMGIAGVAGKAPKRWLFGWALSCAIVPLVVGAFPDALSNEQVMWCFVATIAWMAVYAGLSGDRPRRGRPGRGAGRPAVDTAT